MGNTVEAEEWIEKAACRGMDPNLFVPAYNPVTRRGPSPEAFATCNGKPKQSIPACPVKDECLQYGLDHKCTGCWGGKALYLGRRSRRPR